MITFGVSCFISTQDGYGKAAGGRLCTLGTGLGKGTAWGEAWEGEPYVDVGEGLCSTVSWWSPSCIRAADLTEVP